jgi:hypothetical protein
MSAKKHLILTLLFISVLTINFSLKENGINTLKKTNQIIGNNADSLHIINNLTGTWIWDSTYFTKSSTINYAGLFYEIEFKANHISQVYENNKLIKIVKWEILKNQNNYEIITFPSIEYVSGKVVIKNNQMKLIDNYQFNNEYYFSKCSKEDKPAIN